MSHQISEFGSVTSLKSRFEALASSKPSSQSTSPQPPSSPSQSQPPSLRARPPPPPPPLKPKPFATLPSRAGAFPSIEKETEKENGLLSPDSYGGEEGQRRYRSSSNPESGASRDEPPNPYRGIANVSRSSISMGEGGGGMRTSPSVPDFNIGNERAGRSVSLSSSALSASSPSSTPRSASPNQNATSSSTATSTSASGRRPAPPPPPSKSSLSRSTGSSLSTSPVRVRSPDPSSSPSSSREDARGLKGLISRFEELEQDLSDNSNRTGSGDMNGNEDPFAEIHRLESSSSFSIGAKLAPALPPRGGSLSSSTDTLIPLGLSNSQPQQEKPAIPARPPLTRPAISTLEPSPTPPPALPQRASSSPIARSSPLLPLVPPNAPTNGALSVARLPSAPPLPARSSTPATVSTTPTTITPPLPLPIAQADPKLPGATQWQAPPPPSRSIGLKEKLVPVRPVIKSPVGEEGGEGESSEDEGEEEDATAAALSRLPDATFANRKPPRLGKDLVVKAKAQHFTSYAIKGSIVCTGSSQVKVWDQTNGELIAGVALKGEHRIERMAFKTAVHNPADEGRYLWCGTKDGQLFEIDILRQEVTDSKSAAHSYAIKGIFALGPTMITVDEGGKVVIWLPSAKEEFGLSLPPLLSSKNTKTQRVGEKLGFIKILGDQLWTSTGPSSPHPQTHSKLKAATGPTIRVYDPSPNSERLFVLTQRPLAFPSAETFSSSSSSPSSSAPVIGGVGAVTCGTIVPSHPERVYLGHESGHVSMWSKENLTCLGVLKISQSKITALQGVTRFLWAGYGSGFVFVYDIDVEPWRVQKAWKAHKDPVVDILVDPYTLWANGQLQVASICADATIHFWDGLMKQDWRDNRLLDLQPTYCNFRTIRILICTYNLDASKPENLLQNVKNQSFFHRLLSESGQPDIIVFGFQEMIDLENKRLTAKTLLLGKKKPDQKFNDSISNGYRLWHDELVRALKTYMPSNFPYTVTHVENLVGLFTCVFVKDTERSGLRDVSLMTVKTGMKGRYGNKGAILSRLVMDDTSMCFVNCHLAAGQNHRRQRNKNLIEILEKAALDQAGVGLAYISGGDGTMVFDHEICFLNGDLNYRIDLRRENVLKAVEEGDLKPLLLEDQLNKEMKTNAAFRLRSFKEAPISFLPTYKYDPGTDNYDSSPKLRIPAWCDRILWRADRHEKVKNLKYERHEVDISDHRPVSGLFEVQIKSIIPERLAKAQEGLDVEWKQVEAGLMEKARSFYQRS